MGETSKDIQECTYLSNEKDILVWKMLVKSPTNCNIFVGGLSPDFSSGMLRTAFETFCIKEEDRMRLEVNIVESCSIHRLIKQHGLCVLSLLLVMFVSLFHL